MSKKKRKKNKGRRKRKAHKAKVHSGIIFSHEKIEISPDLGPMLMFFINIEQEVETVLNLHAKLEESREFYLDLLNYTKILLANLPDHIKNSLSYSFKKDHANFVNIIKSPYPTRSQSIVLFSYLESIFIIFLAYTYEVDSKDELIRLSIKDGRKLFKNFIDLYILSKKNKYYKNNHKDLKRINAHDLLQLRNSLVHMFSVADTGLSLIADNEMRKKTRILEESIKSIKFMTPNEFYELIKGASMLLLQRMSDDSLKRPIIFNNKIKYVKNVISKFAPILIQDKDLIIRPETATDK